jgi:hypothetical protein
MTRDFREVTAGTIVILVAVAFLIPSLNYGIGTLRSMQSGLYPLGTALITIAIGIGIILDGLRRRARSSFDERISWRPLLAVSAGIAAFALIAPRFGFLPATVVAVLTSSLGDSESRLFQTLALAAALALAAWLIFTYGLGMPIPAYRI